MKTQRRIALHLIASVLFLSIPLFFSSGLTDPLHAFSNQYFLRNFIGYIFILGFFYINFYCFLPLYYFKRKYLRYSMFVLGCFALVLVLPYAFVPFVNEVQEGYGGHPQSHSLLRHVFHSASHRFFPFILVTILAALIKTSDRLRKVEDEKFHTELAYLRAQVNPHFLFNTLNSIYSLAIDNSDKTAKAIVDLSNMMRYITTEAQRDHVALSDEIVYITNYINLQLIRLGETARVDFNINGDTEGIRIAPLLLIPVIENAFKYGVNPEQDTDIRILIEIKEGKVHLNVFNLVVCENKTGTGRSLLNLKNRLDAIYPNKHRLLIIDGDNEYAVDLNINLND